MTAYQSGNPFQPYLLPRERILWTGRPKQGFALHAMDVFLIPFSLVWIGFVITMLAAVMNSPTPGPPDVMLIVFLLLGLYFTVGRFIHDAALRRRTTYALTEQRA